MNIFKYCRKCKTEKHCSEFYKKSSSPDGYRTTCKSCDKIAREKKKENYGR